MKNLFHDHWMPPMPGGWHFPEKGEYVRGSSPDDVFEKIKKVRSNNGKHADDAALESELWSYWCGLDPARCGQPAITPTPSPREIPKEQWGRNLWIHLNHAAVNFDREYFVAFVAALSRTLIPCEECRGHFNTLLETLPPWSVETKEDACKWAFEAHNRVSQRLGKPVFTWAQAVIEYGFPN